MKKLLTLCVLDPLKALPILLFYGFARLLPVDASSKIFGTLARKLGPFLKVNQLGRDNLTRAFPEKSQADINKILEGVWENLGRIVGEFPHAMRIARDPKRVTMANASIFKGSVKSGRPILFMAGHLGNWEIPHGIVITHQHPIALISRPPNNFWIKKLFDCVRHHPLVTIFFKGSEGSRQIMQHLKAKGSLGVLFDQRLSDGDPLMLFDQQALTATGPAKLAKKYNALMVPVQVERLNNKVAFRITFHEPVDTSQSPEDIMQSFNQHLEDWVRMHPEQWLWLHKRWKL